MEKNLICMMTCALSITQADFWCDERIDLELQIQKKIEEHIIKG